MADNLAVTAGTGTNIASDEVTYSGDTAKLGIVRLVHVTGAEGSKVTSELVRLEDAAATSGDPGIPILGVRQDADTSPVSGDGDYHTLIFNAIGRAKVSSLPAATSTTTGNITASGNTVVVDTTRQSGVTLQVTGTFVGLNMIFEASIDGGTTYNTVQAARSSANVVETTSGVISANPGYFWKIAAFNATNVRVRATAFTSGTAVILFMPTAFASDPAPAVQSSAVTNTGTFATQPTIQTGTNSIGKISDITTAIVPGTAATNLGKAEDAAHSSGDTGVFVLGVSNENLTGFAAASGDYIAPAHNRYGEYYITASPVSHASSNGTPITATTTGVIAAPSAGNHLRILRIHASNGGATATWLRVRDGAAGTQHYPVYIPQGGVYSPDLRQSGPLDLTTATRLDLVLTAAGILEYEIDYQIVAD